MLWADTNKIGCAYAEKPNGDVRVVCNFAPGAPFYLEAKYYCGFIAHTPIFTDTSNDITNDFFLSSLGISLKELKQHNNSHTEPLDIITNNSNILRISDLDPLFNIYKDRWVRENLKDFSNGTKGLIARLVTKYTFTDESEDRCDSDEAIYVAGDPGSMCTAKGRRFSALCYDFREPTPGYRLIAVLAPIALFSLILYDLFNGVVRQTNF